jgi:dienelactone hydrolase
MRLAFGLLVLASLVATHGRVSAEPGLEPAASQRWCASELQTLAGEVCAFVPEKEAKGPRTLVIYLHGVIQPDTTMQWTQQRGAALVGAKYGFTVIMPRGRRGIGPKTMEQWWTWPTSIDARFAKEDALVAEWTAARAALEQKAGKPFERVYVFGFSNGAYYATSLAMRARLDVDGYALFAGGSGAAYHEVEAKKTKRRAPIAVAWGEGDPSHDKQKALAKMLARLRWPSKALGKRRAGHAMTDEQVAEALAFLGSHSR